MWYFGFYPARHHPPLLHTIITHEVCNKHDRPVHCQSYRQWPWHLARFEVNKFCGTEVCVSFVMTEIALNRILSALLVTEIEDGNVGT
jgi:hypothetical protein